MLKIWKKEIEKKEKEKEKERNEQNDDKNIEIMLNKDKQYFKRKKNERFEGSDNDLKSSSRELNS